MRARLLALLSLAGLACASAEKRAVLVSEARIVDPAPPEAVQAVVAELGRGNAAALLDGHAMRFGDRLVLQVLEHDGRAPLPVRWATIEVERPEGRLEGAVGSALVSFATLRASADGKTVRRLAPVEGRFRLVPREGRVWSVFLWVRFDDPAEPALWIARDLGERPFDATTPREGRTSPVASAADYLAR